MSYEGIDILKLFAGNCPGFEDDYKQIPDDDMHAAYNAEKSGKYLKSHDKWNNWLSLCENKGNVNELIRVRRGLQYGMDDLVKKRMGNDFITEMFVRWTMSIERTARRIINKKHPMPPKTHDNFTQWHKAKKARESDFEKFLLKASY